jgi:glycosyltransferase involved in cell wall biosynthesis
MAVLNGERYVAEAIESLRAQSLDDFELIVVDDGSTDSTPQIVAALATEDDRIRLHSQANTGYPEALNVGWRLARGEYVAILDADDLAEPGRLERQVAYLDEHPEVGVVGGSLLLVTGDGRPFYVATYPAAAADVVEGLKTHCPVGHTAVLMRRAILEEVGGYRSAIALSEDYDLWLRVSERHPIVNLPDIVGRYRIHGANGSHASIRRGAEAIVRARADAAERRGETAPPEELELAEAELGLALWSAEVAARAGKGWRRRERQAWRLARDAARRTRDPAASAARVRRLRAKLDAQLGRGSTRLRSRAASILARRPGALG